MTTDLERRQALRDVRDVTREWGQVLNFYLRTEKDLHRGSLGTVIDKSHDSFKVYAYPIQRNPDEKQLARGGLTEKGGAMIYTATLEWVELGLLDLDKLIFNGFDVLRMTVGMDGKEWKVAQVGFANRINGAPMYITFSLS